MVETAQQEGFALVPVPDEPGSPDWLDALSKTDRGTWERQETFLNAFASFGVKTKSCAVAGISVESVRLWTEADRFGFRQRSRDAQGAYQDYLESLALTRVESPKGNIGGDTLLIALNNANNPEKWRGNTTTIELSDEMRDFMQRRQAEDAQKALPEAKVIEHESDEPPPWEDEV